MANEENFVRYRNDGDDFHVLWTARRALRLLDPTSDLVGVSVEGVHGRELDGSELTAGLLVVDTAEYYGSLDLRQARQVVFYQLKYSTQEPDKPWPVSGLADTLRGFADRLPLILPHSVVAWDRPSKRLRHWSPSNLPPLSLKSNASMALMANSPSSVRHSPFCRPQYRSEP
jgi:hypothetical protein